MNSKKREWSFEEHRKNSPLLNKTVEHQDKQHKESTSLAKKGIRWAIIGIIITVILTLFTLFISKNDTLNIEGDNNILFWKSNVEINLPESCDSDIYTKTGTLNLKDYFKQPLVIDNQSFFDENLEYNLFNVMFILPSNQKLFIPEIISNKDYTVAYSNNDYSEVCIVHKYKITSDFDEDNVCFIATFSEDPNQMMFLDPGPKFISDKESCFEKVSGEISLIENWN